MIHLRLVVPREQIEPVTKALLARGDVTNLMHLRGAALRPAGDVILCDVARESTDELLAELHALGVDVSGSIAVETMDTLVSQHPDSPTGFDYEECAESVVWETVEASAEHEVRGGWTFHVFLTLAVALAAIAVKLDSAIVVIAAMVVSPDFSPVAAACVGAVRKKRRHLIGKGLKLLISGFAISTVAVTVIAFLGVSAGWIGLGDLLAPRPQTDFIWTPDRWSFIVALLAGAAGTLSLTSSRSNALVGVFIAVTTVPAAGNLAFAMAVGLHSWLFGSDTATTIATGDTVTREILGSIAQWNVNVAGMFLSGIAALLIAQLLDRRDARRRKLERVAPSGAQPIAARQSGRR